MKNKEKYPKTEDVIKAYYLYRGKEETKGDIKPLPRPAKFFAWLDLEAEEPEKPDSEELAKPKTDSAANDGKETKRSGFGELASILPIIGIAAACLLRPDGGAKAAAPETPEPESEKPTPEKPTLKPCPFCGSTNIKVHPYDFPLKAEVHCHDCFVHPDYVVKVVGDTEAEAIANWNRRAE